MLPQIISGITFKIFSNKLLFCSSEFFFSVKHIGFFVMHFGVIPVKIYYGFD